MPAPTLYLLIRLGADRYAIDTELVVEVLPLVELKSLPGAPLGSAGMMSYRGEAVPVIDLGTLALGSATVPRLMTRIVIVRYEHDDAEDAHTLLGLLVPEVMEATHFDPTRFECASLANDGAPYLGPVLTTSDGVLQLVSVSSLLSDELRRALYPRERAA